MRRRMIKNGIYYMDRAYQQIDTLDADHNGHQLWPWVVVLVLILFTAFMMYAAMNIGHFTWSCFPMYPFS